MPPYPARLLMPPLVGGLLLAGTVIWTEESLEDFLQGEPEGVAIDSQATLRLAPVLDSLLVTESPYLWTLIGGPSGQFYAAGGNKGQVYRVDATGGRLLTSTPEPGVFGLAVAPDGTLYLGSSPDGQIYRLDAQGELVPFHNPASTYIWDLQWWEGQLVVATGLPAELLAINAAGEATQLLQSTEGHFRVLSLDEGGRLLVGSAGEGRVYRFGRDGKAFVLFDSPEDEVVGLAPGKEGVVFVATLRAQQPGGPVGQRPPAPRNQAPAGVGQVRGEPGPAPAGLTGTIYTVDEDGAFRRIWSPAGEAIYSLSSDGAGGVLVGTGEEGRIYRIDDQGRPTLLAEVGSAQVTALAGRLETGLVVAGSNLGRLARLGPRLNVSGTYISRVKDTESFARWGTISWEGETPSGATIELATRTGNTEVPGETWSNWSSPHRQGSGSAITSPPARFIQWRATLRTTSSGETPILRSVSVAYREKNLAPRVDRIEIQPPGVIPPQAGGGPQAQGRPSAQTGEPRGENQKRAPSPEAPGQRAATWEAGDPNRDGLRFDVYYRGEGEERWKLLEEDLDEPTVTWDERALPDGRYRLRVVARDDRENPPTEALTGEAISLPFTIDNTPPQVGTPLVSVAAGTAEIQFQVEDNLSRLAEARYALNGRTWKTIYSEDGVIDSRTEKFRIRLTDLDPGEYTVVILVRDAAGNPGAGKAIFRIP